MTKPPTPVVFLGQTIRLWLSLVLPPRRNTKAFRNVLFVLHVEGSSILFAIGWRGHGVVCDL